MNVLGKMACVFCVIAIIATSLLAFADGRNRRYHCGERWQEMYDKSNALQWLRHCIEVHGRDVNSTEGMTYSHGRSHVTALHIAAEKGALNAVIYLVKAGANLNAKNVLGRTPLHIAAIEGHADICDALKILGANLEIRDVEGYTAFEYAFVLSTARQSLSHVDCEKTHRMNDVLTESLRFKVKTILLWSNVLGVQKFKGNVYFLTHFETVAKYTDRITDSENFGFLIIFGSEILYFASQSDQSCGK